MECLLKELLQFTLIASTCGIIYYYNSMIIIHYTLYIGVIKRYIASVFMIMVMIIMLIDYVILEVMIMRGL